MRNRFAITVIMALAVVAASVVPPPASAQFAVACVNCSSWMTQLVQYAAQGAQYAKQIDEYTTQLKQYQVQIDQYRNMAKNSQYIRQAYFDDALSTVRDVEHILGSARNVSYAWRDIERQFTAQFPSFVDTYAAFDPSRNRSEAQRFLAYSERSSQVFDLARTSLLAAKRQSDSMQEEQRSIDQIGVQLENPEGHLDALQAVGELAQHSAQQMMKMRQIALIQVQIASLEVANRQREADEQRAAAQAMTKRKPADPVSSPNTWESYYRARAPRQ